MTSRSSALLTPFAPSKKDKASIRVYVLRQVSIKVNTIDLWRSYVIAEGSLVYDPQNVVGGIWLKNVPSRPTEGKASSLGSGGSRGSISEREDWASYDWSGELRIDGGQVTVGGFEVGDMKVKVSSLLCSFSDHQTNESKQGLHRSFCCTTKPAIGKSPRSEACRANPAYHGHLGGHRLSATHRQGA